jgi:heterodisulfide reductase subunit B
MRQEGIAAKLGVKHNLPAVYFTQLLGIACGATGKEVMIQKGMVDASQLLRAKNLL